MTFRPRPPACSCCDDTHLVIAASGDLRPCSRCRMREFKAWFDARRPKPAPGPLFDFNPSKKGETP